jgi:hypothetical protein
MTEMPCENRLIVVSVSVMLKNDIGATMTVSSMIRWNFTPACEKMSGKVPNEDS